MLRGFFEINFVQKRGTPGSTITSRMVAALVGSD